MCRLTVFIVAACALMVGLSVCCPQRRYHVGSDTKTWDQARQYCQSNFTDLVSVRSEAEMLTVTALISRVSGYWFWLGLRRNTTNLPWEWSTGEAFQYSNWRNGEPFVKADCGAMDPIGEWAAGSHDIYLNFICMAGPSAQCGQREYFLVHTVKNADEAREHCRSLYTDLVSITSQDVLLDIEQLMNKTTSNIDYWIGLRRDDGSWGWGNRETFSYSNWGAGQPGSNGTCVTIKTSQLNFGEWMVDNCTDNKEFICYKDLQNTTTVLSDSQNSPTTGPAASQIPDGGEQSQQPSTMGGTSPQASSPGHSSSWLPGTSPAVTDNMAIGRVKLTAPRGMNLEDPKVSEAILEQIREHFSKNFPMEDVKMRWRKQNGEIFHKDEEEEE
ncbi:macrophage mannose receptor 1-like isoform X2 [Acipenser ruthenus]|uniref:macrophage mannose receptor 1-like isoform X2 n=1 Tax=Acipenser ruthenus TaxID=7906 RepID=UPI00274282BC|nr:macrophage mannose receptor 1-like isoform X2 [Acipenser ruthenus]